MDDGAPVEVRVEAIGRDSWATTARYASGRVVRDVWRSQWAAQRDADILATGRYAPGPVVLTATKGVSRESYRSYPRFGKSRGAAGTGRRVRRSGGRSARRTSRGA